MHVTDWGACCCPDGDCTFGAGSCDDNYYCTFYEGYTCEDVCELRVCCRSNGDCELTNRIDCFDGHWRESLLDCSEADCGQKGTCCHGEYPDCRCEDQVSLGWCKYHTQQFPMEFYPEEECEDESCRCLEMGACCYQWDYDTEHGEFYCRHQTQEECLHADPWEGGEVQGQWMGKGSLCETHCAVEGRCCIPIVTGLGEGGSDTPSITWSCENIGYEECHDRGGFFNQYKECPSDEVSGQAQCNEAYLETLLHLMFDDPFQPPLPALLLTNIPYVLGENTPELGLAVDSLCDDIKGLPIRADWYGINIYSESGEWIGLHLHVHDGCCCQKYLLFENCCTEDNDGDGYPDRKYAFAVALNCEGMPEDWAGHTVLFDFVSCIFSIVMPSSLGGHIVSRLPDDVPFLTSFDFLFNHYHFVALSPFHISSAVAHLCVACCGGGEKVVDLYEPCSTNESYCDVIESPPTDCKKGAHLTRSSDSEPHPMLKKGCRCFRFAYRVSSDMFFGTPLEEQYPNVGVFDSLVRSCADCGFQTYDLCPENEHGCSGDCTICYGDEPQTVWACRTELLNHIQYGCRAPKVIGVAPWGNRCYKFSGNGNARGEQQTHARCLDSDSMNSCCDCCETNPCSYNCECMPTSVTLQMEVNDPDGCGGGAATFTWIPDPLDDPDQVGYCKMIMRVDNLCGTAMCRDTPPNQGGDCIRTCDAAYDWWGQISPEQYFVREYAGEDMRANVASCTDIDGLPYMVFGGGCDAPQNCDECGSQNCSGCLPCSNNGKQFESVYLPLSGCGPCD